jgi:hypothetical protein
MADAGGRDRGSAPLSLRKRATADQNADGPLSVL